MNKKLLLVLLAIFLSLGSWGQTIIGNSQNPPPPQFAAAPPPVPCQDGQPGCDVPESGIPVLVVLGLILAAYTLKEKGSIA